ncbi:cyclase family protein [Paracraurococcus ruber]|uniref:Cyclase n=1 Tax=Paracraurococcus ruber TaxID=77675 RepID=A0ABS1D6H2_9PROT|nr:cyclase family protein [Paracraurococcus ruber]MBK1662323.1 cyclase [Paracraurococcus ruber]TDG13077.1 cyclase family protein [Paracraurococcus ruber]
MCDACVMGRVAARLGRRGVLAALAAAPAMVAPAMAQPVRSTGFGRVVDLTHALSPAFPTFGGTPAIEMEQAFFIAKDGYNLFTIKHAEHVGTHFDAPLHFSANGASVDAIPLEQLVCPLVVLDVRAKAANDPDYQVTPEDVAAHEAQQGRIPQGACVALNSGWDAHVATPRFRNAQADGSMRFPGFRPDVAPLLAGRGVLGVAVDTLSLDHGGSKDFAFHTAWLGSGRWGIECVANLGALPPTGATIVAAAPKIAGGTGGPGRVLALA